jgi:hypothetical protein
MKTIRTLLSVATLLLAANAYAGPSTDQPRVPNAYYGRDGFWHCNDGYLTGEDGTCQPADYRRSSAYTRLRDFDDAERMKSVSAHDDQR